MKHEERYRFKAYNPSIVKRFEKEKEKLLVIIPYARIEHIGSTAVPELGGKGILDIMIFVPRMKIPLAKRTLMKYYDYRPLASKPTRIFFKKEFRMNKKQNRLHLHLIHTQQELRKVILFRDYLLANPQAVKKYALVKRSAARRAKGDIEIYKAIKKPFIEYILKKCR